MDVQGTVFNNANDYGLTGVVVTVVDSSGTLQDYSNQATTDNNGHFALSSLDLDHGGILMFSLPGFTPVMVDPALFNQSSQVGLDSSGPASGPGLPATSTNPFSAILNLFLPKPAVAPPAGAKPGMLPVPAQTNIAPYLIGGGVLLVGGYFLFRPKKKNRR